MITTNANCRNLGIALTRWFLSLFCMLCKNSVLLLHHPQSIKWSSNIHLKLPNHNFWLLSLSAEWQQHWEELSSFISSCSLILLILPLHLMSEIWLPPSASSTYSSRSCAKVTLNSPPVSSHHSWTRGALAGSNADLLLAV